VERLKAAQPALPAAELGILHRALRHGWPVILRSESAIGAHERHSAMYGQGVSFWECWPCLDDRPGVGEILS